VILSNGYYIDLNQPTDFHYLNDPVPGDSPLTPEERKLVLGGEATMWSEIVTAETVDSRVWPRTAAIAERLWSAGTVRDVDEMYRRLDIIDRQLEEAGLTHLKNREMMLRRLAGGGAAHPLRILAGVVEPIKIYERQKVGITYTSFSPFTRMVDAAVADPRPAREFNRRVDRFLSQKNENAIAELTGSLTSWKENHAAVQVLVDRSPVLKEIEPLSKDLAAAAALGLEALDVLMGKTKPGPSWSAEAKRLIEKARSQRGELELAILPAITKLVEAVSGK
jgi:hexosaminidase